MKTARWFLFSTILLGISRSDAAPLTNNVPVTTNLTFFLTTEKNTSSRTNRYEFNELIYRGLVGNWGDPTGRNIIFCKTLPFSQSFDFKLFDGHGKEVQKTKCGSSNSRTPGRIKDATDADKFTLLGIIGADIRAMFRPDEMFVITNKGVYELEVKIRLCVPMTNGVPNTQAMKRLKYWPDWGVVVSAPVRVKVVKE